MGDKPEITGPRMQALDLSTDECVEWPGAMRNGYGVKKMGNTTVNAHRWVYEQATGKKIPKGMAVDHTCRNRKCVNPKHLEVVSHGENKLRAWGFKSGNYKHKYYKGEPVEKSYSQYQELSPVKERRIGLIGPKVRQRKVRMVNNQTGTDHTWWATDGDLEGSIKVKRIGDIPTGVRGISKSAFGVEHGLGF